VESTTFHAKRIVIWICVYRHMHITCTCVCAYARKVSTFANTCMLYVHNEVHRIFTFALNHFIPFITFNHKTSSTSLLRNDILRSLATSSMPLANVKGSASCLRVMPTTSHPWISENTVAKYCTCSRWHQCLQEAFPPQSLSWHVACSHYKQIHWIWVRGKERNTGEGVKYYTIDKKL